MFIITSHEYPKLIAELLEEKIATLLKEQELVTLGIPGGKSIIPVLHALRTANIPWKKIHLFWIDERVVPITDTDSNYALAEKELLASLKAEKKIPAKNIHPFTSLETYEKDLADLDGTIDIIIAGAGEDGHIASLFPEHEALESEEDFIHITDSPKPPAERYTIGPALVSQARLGIILFIGKEKQSAYNQFEKAYFTQCPATLIKELPEVYVFRCE